MIRNARSTASTVASHWSKNSESTRSPRAPIAREVRVTPSCIAAMKCGGSLVIFMTERAVRLPSSASSFTRVRRTVTSAYSPATKNALRRISRTTATSSTSTVIADTSVRSYRPGTLERRERSPRPGHWYSEASRRPLLRRSIGDSPDVLGAPSRSLQHEPLEVRERLRHRKPACRRLQVVTEEREGDLITGQRLVSERGGGRCEPLGVVGDQRAGARARVEDRFSVPGKRDARVEGDRRLEGVEIVAERVGTASRPQPDRRSDRIEHVVGCDEHVVADEHQLAVRVAGCRDRAPSVDVVAGIEKPRIRLEADERPPEGTLLDQLLHHLVGHALTAEPVDEHVRPVASVPDEAALLVVDPSLRDGRPRELDEVRRRSDVVRVEVGDDDLRDRAGKPCQLARPPLLGIRQAEPGVDDRPAVVARQEIRVDVPRARRQRQRHTADPSVELVHAATLRAACRDMAEAAILTRNGV